MFVRSVAVAVLSLGSAACAVSIVSKCPQSDLCYQVNIPEATATSGKGDIFFQISASTSYQWVALGQGSQMAGSNMFVMYTSANGQNVTLSPRLGTGHSEPQHDTAAQVTLLGGSGVSNGRMTANVRCGNCDSWSGGSMDLTGSSSTWITAYKTGSSLASDDLDESISQHNAASSFTLNLASAQGGSDANPFLSGSVATTTATGLAASCTPVTSQLAQPSGSGCPTAWPSEFSTSWPTARPTWATSCFAVGHPWPTAPPWAGGPPPWAHHHPHPHLNLTKRVDDYRIMKRADDSCPAGYSSSSDGKASFENNGFGGLTLSQEQRMVTAHAVMACLAFVALFPIGGTLIRLANFTGLVWVHAAVQVLGFIVYIIAFGLGVMIASRGGYMMEAHPIIGIALFVVLLFQPVFGLLHHRLYQKYQHRTLWSYAHLSVGRIAILLGMVNGGLGLQLAGASKSAKSAYAVIAVVVGLIYILAVVFGELKQKRRSSASPPTYERSQREVQQNYATVGRGLYGRSE